MRWQHGGRGSEANCREAVKAQPSDAKPANTKPEEAAAGSRPARARRRRVPPKRRPLQSRPMQRRAMQRRSRPSLARARRRQARAQAPAKAEAKPSDAKPGNAASAPKPAEPKEAAKPKDLTPKPDAAQSAAIRPSTVNGLYNIHFMGAHIGDFKIHSSITTRQYSLQASADISAFFGMVSWQGVTGSYGLMTANGPVPQNYTFRYATSDKREALRSASSSEWCRTSSSIRRRILGPAPFPSPPPISKTSSIR